MNFQQHTMIQVAFQAYQVGSFLKAERVLLKYLRCNPNEFDAVHLLAVVYASQGKHLSAIKFYKKALKISPNDASTLSNWGSSLSAIGQSHEALLAFKRALDIKPNNPDFCYNLANTLCDLGKQEEGLSYYEQAIKFNPMHYQALNNFGKALFDLKRFSDSLIYFDKAFEINQFFLECLINKSEALKNLRRYTEALDCQKKVIEIRPTYHQAWSNLGNILKELQRFDEAIIHYDKALSLKPDYFECWYNKGNALYEFKQFNEAIACYDKALSLKPDDAEVWANKGNSLHQLNHYEEAIALYDKSLSLKPNYHDASWNKGLSLLLQGDFENGFILYESRWNSKIVSEIGGKRFFDKPTWLGVESLQDKTILLYGEQGLGDFIQFCRYVKLVAGLGAHVILEVPQPLTNLMRSLDGISQLVTKGEKLPFFDYQCPLLSLPLAFRTNLYNIPNPSGYINVDNSSNKILEWETRLGLKLKPRIGLVWSGSLHHKNDHNRSILLRDILPFLPNQFEYVSLQKEVREADKAVLNSNSHILNFANFLNDFLDTATLINNLDLIISVDTSVAHLSAALGKRTWLLLPNVPDWRWLLDRGDSPWYTSVKLYRQPKIGDWNSVFEKVKLDLNCYFK